MQIFRRKPFMFCCFCFIASAVISFLVVGKVKIAAIIALSAICLSLLIILLCVKKREIKIKLAVFLIACVMSVGGFLNSYFYFDVRAAAFDPYVGKVVKTEVTVIEERKAESFYSEYLVEVSSLEGTEAHGKAILRIEGENGLRKGETVEMLSECLSLREYAFSKSALLSYVSDGITGAFSVTAEDAVDISVKERADKPTIDTLNGKLTYKLETLVNGEAGRLSAAMLLGRKDRLSDVTSRDFSRSGIAHTLALSGLHLAVLAGFFDFILKKSGAPKILRCVFLPFVIFCYLALTGFAISTVRAAIMLGSVYLAYIIAAPIDKLTVLFASCAAILSISPSAVVDIGFWMSYVSTFGLMLGAPYLSKIFKPIGAHKASDYPKVFLRAALRYIFTAVLVAAIAAFSLLLLSQIAFGEISVVSPVANLLCGPLVTAELILSFLLIILGTVPFVGELIAFLLKNVGDSMLGVAAYFSDIENATVSLEYNFARVLVVLFTVSMAVLLVIKLRRKAFLLLPAITFAAAFAICFFSLIIIKGRENADITYLRRGENEMLFVASGNEFAFIDLSDGNYSNFSSAWDQAHSGGATELENVVLTHYHRKHAYSLSRLMSSVKVRRITLPYPKNYDEALHLSAIYKAAEEYEVECVLMSDEGYTELIKGVGIELLPREFIWRSKQSVVAFNISAGNKSLAYIGSSYYESSFGSIADETVTFADYVIYGTHGPNPKADFSVGPAENAKEIIFANRELVGLSYCVDKGLEAFMIAECEMRRMRISILTE